MSVATKKEAALGILERTALHIHLDPRRPGVVLPKHLSREPGLTIAVARSGLPALRVELAADVLPPGR